MRHLLPRILARWAGREEEVGAWGSERELTGSALPGNLRGSGALSIGTASFEVPQSPRRTPWEPILPDRVTTEGHEVELAAVYDDGGDEMDLGAWRTDPISGSLIEPTLGVELVERTYDGREKPQRVWMDALRQEAPEFAIDPKAPYPVDPIWVVSQLAGQMGYFEVPPPVPSSLLTVPFQGGAQDLGGDMFSAVFLNWLPANRGPITAYNRSTGALGASGTPFLALYYDANTDGRTDVFQDGSSVYYTLNVVGEAQINHPAGRVTIDATLGELTVTHPNDPTPTQTVYYNPGLNEHHPHRVQVECQATVSHDGVALYGWWTGFRARARSDQDAGWGPWAEVIFPSPRVVTPMLFLTVGTGTITSSISGFQMTTETDPALWAPPNAEFSLLDGRMDSVWFRGGLDVWSAIQEVCSSYIASAWVNRHRRLIVRNRDEMAGVGQPVRKVDIEGDFEDLRWTVDPGDSADRLEVTYHPVDFVDQVGSPPVSPVAWQASDVLTLGPGQTVEVVADLDSAIAFDYAAQWWVPAWYGASLLDEYSVWSALPNRDGTGTQPPDDALDVRVRPASAGRAIVTVKNTTTATLYTVDRNGQPCLIMKTVRRADQNNPAVVTRGVPAEDARRPLQVDLGRHVQRQEDAEAVADYLWARLSAGLWRADSVRVALDWSYDLGDVLLLDYGDLQTKALVTKVSLTGGPGEIQQRLDLAILPTTWADFDEVWAGSTWNDFDFAWSALTWDDFDRDPTRR